MLDAEVFAVVHLVIQVLDNKGIPYVIGGSVASTVHGLIRTTLDIDLVVDLKQEHVTPFIAALSSAFYLDEDAIRQAIERRSNFNLIHLQTMFKVDIFLPQGRAFDRQQLARRQPERLLPDADDVFWVLSAEDVILAKLDWFRQGGEVSERQWRDILGVVKTQGGQLDIDYLRQWARQLEVADLLERALEEA